MCIFTQDPESVSETRILVSPTNEKGLQLTIYSNKVKVGNQRTAMILPYPTNKNNDPCIVLDMTGFEANFQKLDDLFYHQLSLSNDSHRDGGRQVLKSMMLEVFQVGSYKCSIASCLSDLDRIQASEFGLDATGQPGLPRKIKALLSEKYRYGFGFLVCRIDETAEFSPVGYVHPMLNNQLFIPTLHEHDDQPVWDHRIYVIDSADTLHTNGSHRLSLRDHFELKNPGVLALSDLLTQTTFRAPIDNRSFSLPRRVPDKHIKKWMIKGFQPNVDLFCKCAKKSEF